MLTTFLASLYVLRIASSRSFMAISEKSYGAGTSYTNDRYLDQGFHFWEELAVRAWFTQGNRVMVAAAGGGR